MNSENIRVCIIDDHAIVRAGVHMLVEQDPAIEVVGEATNVSEILDSMPSTPPDVILLDLCLRGENGVDLIPQIIEEFPGAGVLVLTAIEDVETHLLSVQAGARGVVLKEEAPKVLVDAIRAVYSGENWIGQSLSRAALNKLFRRTALESQLEPHKKKIALLTPREREVVQVVARGYSGARIAAELHISEATVRHHLTSILSKLELSNKLELAVYAFQHGLIEPQESSPLRLH